MYKVEFRILQTVLGFLIFKKIFKDVFERARASKHACKQTGWGSGRERISSRLHAEGRAPSPSRTLRSQPELKSEAGA